MVGVNSGAVRMVDLLTLPSRYPITPSSHHSSSSVPRQIPFAILWRPALDVCRSGVECSQSTQSHFEIHLMLESKCRILGLIYGQYFGSALKSVLEAVGSKRSPMVVSSFLSEVNKFLGLPESTLSGFARCEAVHAQLFQTEGCAARRWQDPGGSHLRLLRSMPYRTPNHLCDEACAHSSDIEEGCAAYPVVQRKQGCGYLLYILLSFQRRPD